ARADVKANVIASRVPGLRMSDEFGVVPGFLAVAPQSAVPVLAALPNVRYASPDGAVQVLPDSRPGHTKAAKQHPPKSVPQSKKGLDSSNLVTTYPFDTRATDAWSGSDGHIETGANIAVAVIDSGLDVHH